MKLNKKILPLLLTSSLAIFPIVYLTTNNQNISSMNISDNIRNSKSTIFNNDWGQIINDKFMIGSTRKALMNANKVQHRIGSNNIVEIIEKKLITEEFIYKGLDQLISGYHNITANSIVIHGFSESNYKPNPSDGRFVYPSILIRITFKANSLYYNGVTNNSEAPIGTNGEIKPLFIHLWSKDFKREYPNPPVEPEKPIDPPVEPEKPIDPPVEPEKPIESPTKPEKPIVPEEKPGNENTTIDKNQQTITKDNTLIIFFPIVGTILLITLIALFVAIYIYKKPKRQY